VLFKSNIREATYLIDVGKDSIFWQEGLSPDRTFSRDRRAVGIAGEAKKFFSSVLHLIFIAQ
jgi:hypothetical protein